MHNHVHNNGFLKILVGVQGKHIPLSQSFGRKSNINRNQLLMILKHSHVSPPNSFAVIGIVSPWTRFPTTFTVLEIFVWQYVESKGGDRLLPLTLKHCYQPFVPLKQETTSISDFWWPWNVRDNDKLRYSRPWNACLYFVEDITNSDRVIN